MPRSPYKARLHPAANEGLSHNRPSFDLGLYHANVPFKWEDQDHYAAMGCAALKRWFQSSVLGQIDDNVV